MHQLRESAPHVSVSEPIPPDVERILGRVDALLSEGKTKEALGVVRQARSTSPWLTNAAAVCRLRLGEPNAALQAFRGLALRDSITLRDDAPAAFKLNLALALLATGNVAGFRATLGELSDSDHPAVARYRDAYRRANATVPLWRRLLSAVLGPPDVSFPPEIAVGELR